MKLKKRMIPNKKERVALSDVLPYELPITFSNRHFYSFLVENQIEIDDDKLRWKKNDPILTEIIKLLFGFKKNKPDAGCQITIDFKKGELNTIPFNYKISHKDKEFRELTIIHPCNQLALIEFYDKHKELILYYCNISPFSIRKAHKTARLTYHKDKTHFESLAHDYEHKAVEELGKEYEHLKTFFVYKKFSNVYKFYESYIYHKCEKKYNKMFKFDISKCFDSIYSHSISWALLNKPIVKDNLKPSKKTFGGKFDVLMQSLNYGETNGIIIGPEFSRIFAEIILQQIDINVLHSLSIHKKRLLYKKDYEIFRYVDDYFVFYNDDKTIEDILQTYRLQLKEYKLYINDSKSETFEKPIITGITRAKQQINELFNKNLVFKVSSNKESEGDLEENTGERHSLHVSSNKLITQFKSIIKDTNIEYKDILNYALACIDRKILKFIETCSKISDKSTQEPKITKAIIEMLDYIFFLYSGAPRVNTTIKLCMILSKITKFAKIKGNFNYDNKHLILKKIYDEISLVLAKNQNSEYTQVETLYLLIALKELGRDYRLDEKVLSHYSHIDIKERKCNINLNYFSIMVLLSYIENKPRYNDLKAILITHIEKKFKSVSKGNIRKTTELTLLLFDILACPYLDVSYKKEILSLYEINDESLQNGIIKRRKYWFTKWTDFDLAKELDAKKSQEVY